MGAKRIGKPRSIARSAAKAISIGYLAAVLVSLQAHAANDGLPLSSPSRALPRHATVSVPATADSEPALVHPRGRVGFDRETASKEAHDTADWVMDTGDNRGMPFVIVDKRDARVFLFDANGRLRGAAPALLGLARGDDAVPGIGERKLSSIRPEERTTPAGRFVAALGRNLRGQDILWVDYDGAISLHRVITSNPKEHRLQRLATATALDNRITYGCINVPVRFYEDVVRPAFRATDGIVYVLPEARLASEVFGAHSGAIAGGEHK